MNKLKIILTPSSYVQLQSFIKIGGLVSEKNMENRKTVVLLDIWKDFYLGIDLDIWKDFYLDIVLDIWKDTILDIWKDTIPNSEKYVFISNNFF